jgi:hypothetical protein
LVVEGLYGAGTVDGLAAEARRLRGAASVTENAEDDGEDVRGGRPARRFLTVSGGPEQTAVYLVRGVSALLTRLAGLPIQPSGGGGTYSYYVQPGDFLALHRDIETCDVAVITALVDTRRTDDAAGALCLYPGRFTEPLSRLRSAPTRGAVAVRLRPGQSIVLLGGVTPHELLPIAHGQQRIVSVLCYQALPSRPPAGGPS